MRKPRNVGASIRARLLNLARKRNEPFDLLLTRYVLERFLYRLSLSRHRDRFVLKGALLIATWFDDVYRPTRDLDLLGFGDSDPDGVIRALREVAEVPADDAVAFDMSGTTVDRIREESDYGGLRVKAAATIDGARVRIVIDVGFGDAIEPGLQEIDLPVLLDAPAPRLRAYPRETVVAEKFQTMVVLGRANSRMKDFYDLWLLARSHEFKGDALARAIAATFARRATEIPVETPDALTRAFADDPTKVRQWTSFGERIGAKPTSFRRVIADLAAFLMPQAVAARRLGLGAAGRER
jgi:predicted nucleotidyltransferase component of viral defense system